MSSPVSVLGDICKEREDIARSTKVSSSRSGKGMIPNQRKLMFKVFAWNI